MASSFMNPNLTRRIQPQVAPFGSSMGPGGQGNPFSIYQAGGNPSTFQAGGIGYQLPPSLMPGGQGSPSTDIVGQISGTGYQPWGTIPPQLTPTGQPQPIPAANTPLPLASAIGGYGASNPNPSGGGNSAYMSMIPHLLNIMQQRPDIMNLLRSRFGGQQRPGAMNLSQLLGGQV